MARGSTVFVSNKDNRVTQLIPGPGEIVVGGANGPQKKPTQDVLGRVVVPWRPGRYYDFAAEFRGGQTTALFVANRIYAAPLYVPETRTIDRIAVNVTTAGAAGSKLRLMIFAATATDMLPGTLVLDAGEVPADAVTQQRVTITPLTLNGPALYYTAAWSGGTPTITGYTNQWTGQGLTDIHSSVSPTPYQDLTYGAAPSAFAITDYGTIIPRVAVRAV